MVNDFLISFIRTAVPVAVGAVLAWLASKTGIVLDADSSASLTAGVVAVVVAVYYALARVLEIRWPWLGLLLGRRAKPVYEVPRTSKGEG
ncbi:hypothetical protein [Salinispora oceanensis]|uniref:hypothetical protein n=1 Tax=Salinispora oceanensis TaxID=1050199 RepID=UPI0003786D5F|nr:hypothetical protein [Salinispora oceanensis]